VTDFQNYFTSRLSSKFAIKQRLRIQPHRKHVATLPREILSVQKVILLT